jgi:branched-chain amino acid aminotransferase
MSAVAYVNGRICSERDAAISVFDHGFLYGEGVYEVIRTYGDRLFLVGRHFRRLRASASMITLGVGMGDDALEAVVRETIAAYRAGAGEAGRGQEVLARILVTRGIGEMSYDPTKAPAPSLVVIVKPLVPPPPSAYERGVAVSLVSVVRNHPASVDPRIKSNNLLNNVLAMQEALRRGPAFEAIMRNYRGELAECSQSNLFLIKDGTVRTPAIDAGLLAGITREFVEEVAVDAGIPMEDSVLRDDDLFGADEAFLTSTSKEIVPIVRVDDRVIGSGQPGPITLRLLDAYRQRARELTRHARAAHLK